MTDYIKATHVTLFLTYNISFKMSLMVQWLGAGRTGPFSFPVFTLNVCSGSTAVFRHDVRMKSGEFGPDLIRSLPFTLEQHSRRFSAQTQQILRRIQVKGGAAGKGRKWRNNSAVGITWFYLQHIDSGVCSATQTLCHLCVIYVCVTPFSLGKICF